MSKVDKKRNETSYVMSTFEHMTSALEYMTDDELYDHFNNVIDFMVEESLGIIEGECKEYDAHARMKRCYNFIRGKKGKKEHDSFFDVKTIADVKLIHAMCYDAQDKYFRNLPKDNFVARYVDKEFLAYEVACAFLSKYGTVALRAWYKDKKSVFEGEVSSKFRNPVWEEEKKC